MKYVCVFGIYKKELPLNQVLIKGFERNGYVVVECHIDPTKYSRIGKYFRLFLEYRKIKHIQFDYVVVGVPGQTVVWIAKLLFGGPIVFDACHSIFDANVVDRKLYSSRSFRGLKDWFLDWHSVRLADFVLFHTHGTLRYFVDTFKVIEERCGVLYTGMDETLFSPKEKDARDIFYVHFHGAFTPVQGGIHVVDAGNYLRDKGVEIHIVGYGGSLYDEMKRKAKNDKLEGIIFFEGKVQHSEIPSYIAKADVCVGNLGDTPKALTMSVPTKLFEYIAMRKPVITGRSEAIKELFVEGKTILFVDPASGKDLADKILALKENARLQEKLATESYQLFLEKLTYKAVVSALIPKLPKRYVS